MRVNSAPTVFPGNKIGSSEVGSKVANPATAQQPVLATKSNQAEGDQVLFTGLKDDLKAKWAAFRAELSPGDAPEAALQRQKQREAALELQRVQQRHRTLVVANAEANVYAQQAKRVLQKGIAALEKAVQQSQEAENRADQIRTNAGVTLSEIDQAHQAELDALQEQAKMLTEQSKKLSQALVGDDSTKREIAKAQETLKQLKGEK